MAQNNTTTIVLKTVNDGEDTEELSPENFTDNQEKLSQHRKRLVKRSVDQIGLLAINEVMTNVRYDIGNYSSLTENYKLRVQMDNVSTTIGKVNSMASSALNGAIIGAQINAGTGAAIGAIIAIVGETINTATDLMRQYASQNLSLSVNDIQTTYSQSRLVLIDNGRGTQN